MAITYAQGTRIITVVGWADEPDNTLPWVLLHLYEADKAGILGLRPSSATTYSTYNTNGNMSLLTAMRPCDDLELPITVEVSAITDPNPTIVFTFNGLDKDDNPVSEALALPAVGTYTTTQRFKSINTNGVVRSGFHSGDSITCRIQQARWGEIWKERGTLFDLQFLIPSAKLVIGDGTTNTSFYDVSKQLALYAVSPQIRVRNNADFQTGDLLNETNKSTSNPLQIRSSTFETIRGEAGSDVFLYSLDLNGGGLNLYGTTQRLWNCKFNNTQIRATNLNIFNPTIGNCSYAFRSVEAALGGTFDKITIMSVQVLLGIAQFSVADVILRNVYGRLIDYVVSVAAVGAVGYPNVYLVNADLDVWTFLWVNYDKKVYRQYEFDATVRNGRTGELLNGTATLQDATGTIVFTVPVVDGVIATQTVSHGYFDQPHGNVEQLYGPFRLTIEVPGYQTYDDYNLPLDKKTELHIGMNRIVDLIFVDDQAALNLDEDNPESEEYTYL